MFGMAAVWCDVRRMGFGLLFALVALATPRAVGADQLQKGEAALEFPAETEWFGGPACKLADFTGKKAVLLYFLLPGCGSCDNFAPHLYRLALQNKEALTVIGLTAHPKKDEVATYAQKRMGDYPVAALPDKEYVSRYIGHISQFPYIVLIGKDGLIKWFGRGKFHEQVTAEVERTLGRQAEDQLVAAGKRSALVVSAPEGQGALKAPLSEGGVVAAALRKAGYDPVVALGGTGAPATVENVKKELKTLTTGKTAGEEAVLFFYTGDAKQTGATEGQAGLELLLDGGGLTLSDLRSTLPAEVACKMLWAIDAGQEDSKLPEWEDIGVSVSAGLPGVTLLLAASRYDRSRLLTDDPAGTLFGKLFIELLQSPVGKQDMIAGWRFLRDEMSRWSRANDKGTLQSPFIYGPGAFSLLPGGADEAAATR